jgi:hypothetical protein
MNLGSSDFTIEFWVYINALGGSQDPLYSTFAGAKTDVLALDMNSGGVLGLYATPLGGGVWSITSGATVGTLVAGAWYHVAIVRSGSTWNGYLNGVRGSGFPITNSSALASFDGFNIGQNGVSGAYLNGYIDDLRITRGFARYTANFVPPTSALQLQ